MKHKQPYKYWTRGELFNHLKKQVEQFNFADSYTDRIEYMIFDKRWNPMKDFNGCNIVQDKLHPFLPCFIHDYQWIMNTDNDDGAALKHDKEFYSNLRATGFSKIMASLYFIGVRAGWLFYYRWK